MLLWSHWWLIVSQLRPACSRQRTFLWLAVTLAASSATLLVGAFGRREIIGLFFSIVWALYFEKWRYMPVSRLFPRLTFAVAGLSLAVLVFSASRVGGQNVDRSLGQQVERLLQIEWENVQGRFFLLHIYSLLPSKKFLHLHLPIC